MPFAKLLDRYLFRQMIVPFMIGTIAVTLMFDANLIIYLGKTFNLSVVPPAAIIQYILAKTPFFLNMTLPVGVALGGSLAMSRLSSDSEITAMRSAGASIKRCLVPFTLFGLLAGGLAFYLNEQVIPRSEQFAGSLERRMGALMITPNFTQNAALRLDRYSVFIGTANRTAPEGIDVNDLVLVSRPQPGTIEIITARNGRYDHGLWTMRDAAFRFITGDDTIQFRKENQFTINEKINIEDLFVPPPPEQLSLQALAKSIALAKKEGRDARSLEIQLHGRFSVPAACLIFGAVAPLLALPFARSGGFAGVLLSVFLVFLYYNSYVISTEIIGRNGWLPPILASWLTNLIFIVIGLIAAKRME